jgi:hypothetical protein
MIVVNDLFREIAPESFKKYFWIATFLKQESTSSTLCPQSILQVIEKIDSGKINSQVPKVLKWINFRGWCLCPAAVGKGLQIT